MAESIIAFRISFDAVAPIKIPSHRKAAKPVTGIKIVQKEYDFVASITI